jgi:histidine ammonia-lyase
VAVALTGTSLTIEEVVRVARGGEQVQLEGGVRDRVRDGRAIVEAAVASGEVVYALTTGVGVRKRVRVPADELPEFNRRLILEHRVGQGELAPDDVVRAQALVIANGFARGTSGVRFELLERVLSVLNEGPLPPVRTLGSIGTSDLPANADLAHGVMDGLPLEAKEAIALMNQNAFSTGLAALAVNDATRLLQGLDVAAALDLEALGANLSILHSDDGTFVRLLEGTETVQRDLQDPLSFRVVPHLHAGAREALAFVRGRIERDLNRSQENPFVLLEEKRIFSVGNFDVSAMSAALDFARISLAPVLTTASERAIKLLQSPVTGLPEGLAAEPGLAESGLSEFGVPVQALAAEAKLLAQPVSIETGSTSHHEGIEDRVTLAPLAARRLLQQVELGERLAAIELTIAAQAIDLRGRPGLGRGTRLAFERVRSVVPMTRRGEAPPQDLEGVRALVRSGELARPT